MNRKHSFPRPLISDEKGTVIDLPGCQALGMKADTFMPIEPSDLIPLPYSSRIMLLPERSPVVFNKDKNEIELVETHPQTGGGCHTVAAFIAPGWTITHNPAFMRRKNGVQLPLYAYAAVVWYKGAFYTTAVRVERERRQDVRLMNVRQLKKNIQVVSRMFPKNRLVKHLEGCAIEYGCPAAQNFFLRRYEGPLPTSPSCNARCLGCLSLQPSGCCPSTQPRITFSPTPDEVAEVAIFHLTAGARRVVSFGQGCEGEPLCNADVLISAVKIIRKRTKRGTINLNTNASRPDILKRLFEEGLDSIRVSMNSVRKTYYERYFRPKTYGFNDVLCSITVANRFKRFVSLNYFVQPGFTDSVAESTAFLRFLSRYPIDVIQWRNLNYDPEWYFNELFENKKNPTAFLGVKELLMLIKEKYPRIKYGYFNPPKEKF